jgi:hypothetical protein
MATKQILEVARSFKAAVSPNSDQQGDDQATGLGSWRWPAWPARRRKDIYLIGIRPRRFPAVES